MQAMGWRIVHTWVRLHVYEYSKKAVQELTGYQKRVPVPVIVHLEVCDHEVLLVMSPVMQATGWRIVHICLVHSVVKLQLARIFLPERHELCVCFCKT